MASPLQGFSYALDYGASRGKIVGVFRAIATKSAVG
jgi:hypothetical protein